MLGHRNIARLWAPHAYWQWMPPFGDVLRIIKIPNCAVYEFYITFSQETGPLIKSWTFTVVCSAPAWILISTDVLYSVLLHGSGKVAAHFSAYKMFHSNLEWMLQSTCDMDRHFSYFSKVPNLGDSAAFPSFNS